MTIKMFTKRPIPTPAVQWNGSNLLEVIEFIEGKKPDTKCHAWTYYENMVSDSGLKIQTLEGEMSASVGDWIIRGIKGECYPCKPDIFDLTYQALDDVAELNGGAVAGQCDWHDDDGIFQTACGKSWSYTEGGTPEENGQHYCHGCGKPINLTPICDCRHGRDACTCKPLESERGGE